MITFVGDIHGYIHDLWWLVRDYSINADDVWIQVGDFWFDPKISLDGIIFPNKVYWIDGNHEIYSHIMGITEPTEVYPNLIYVPRGTVMEIQGLTIGFLGGGESPDKDSPKRIQGKTWWKEETISYADMMKFSDVDSVDILVTHVPPISVVTSMSDSTPEEWNWSSRSVEAVWEKLGRPPLVCGHMHRSFTAMGVHVLDINEIMYYKNGEFVRHYE